MCTKKHRYLSDSFKRAPLQLVCRALAAGLVCKSETRVCTFGLRSRHVVRRRHSGLELIVKSGSRESFSAAEDEQMAGGWCVKAAAGGDLNVEYAETPEKRVIL